MKITRIRTHILRVPLGTERSYSSQCAFPERKSLLVRIDTDDVLVGRGEGGQYGPAEPVIEYDRSPNPLREELLVTPIALEGGRVPVPQGPGLGVQVNEAALERYTRR